MEIYGYIAIIGVGIILGLMGGGGSILSVPILVYLFAQEVVMASAYSLFLVGTTSLVGCFVKHQNHLVNFKLGCTFGIPSVIAIFSTRKWIIPAMPDLIFQLEAFRFTKRGLILGVFAILMVVSAVAMLTGKEWYMKSQGENKSFLVTLCGLATGFLTGLVGAGGGFLILPALIFSTKLNFKTAVGTTLFIIAANSLLGFGGDVINYTINWNFLASITSLSVAGIVIGSKSSPIFPGASLKKAFGWLTLVIGAGMLIKEIFFVV